METRMVEVPNLNKNEEIEQFATKLGAYAGAGLTALVGGLATGVWSLFQGAKVGAVVTHSNMNNVSVPVQDTSIAAKQRQFTFEGGKFREINTDNPQQQVNPAAA